ncbi:GNAT family N-acetyltransferase [Neobacillus niacini]|uniref:GNAT family N-acetyltransferase n=1 Tax=Neobacillus niacini TaxID=86668 RepID=UPI0007AB31AA|nr:GNAT family N-acetyltransferase [Neobacillus niacini]MEC1525307.1 GNAT family N-acetyltransferase [Neobacillus niacini]
MSVQFEEITKETLYIALEMINSNPEYNLVENGIALRELADIKEEFLNQETISVFIKLDETYIGVMDYLLENPKDQSPWLGLLMIHRDYQGFGFGAQAYALYESEMHNRGLKCVRLGVIKENVKAKQFWESLGFLNIKTAFNENGKEILVFEKNFPKEVLDL